MNTILVSSHRRSGTHFLIDSLRKNISGSEFPNHRHLPADFNIGSLFSKQEKVYTIFKKLLLGKGPVIIKSHLLPEESYFPTPQDKYEDLINEIFIQSKKLYISRDGKDVLISLYKYLKSESPFGEFIREPNDHIVHEVRSSQDFDMNRVSYWSYHVNQWQRQNAVYFLRFEDLIKDFDTTMGQMLGELGYNIPQSLGKPQIPDHMLWHHFQKKLNHFGLAPLPECSSVRPNKRTARKPAFSNADDQFYNAQTKGDGVDE